MTSLGRTTAGASLFFYDVAESWDTFNDESFVPLFLEDLMSSAEPDFLAQSQTMCQGDTRCLFDALATRSLQVGVDTRDLSQEFTEEANDLGEWWPTSEKGGGSLGQREGKTRRQVTYAGSASDS